jgi:hypothetical protein
VYEFVQPSEKALKATCNEFQKKYNFPFEKCPVGMSFVVRKDEVSAIGVLRSLCTRQGQRWGKQFRVTEHEDRFEISCVRLRDEGPQQPKSVGRPAKVKEPKQVEQRVIEPTAAPKFFTDSPNPKKKYGVLVAEPDHETGIGRAGCYQCGTIREFNAYETPYDAEKSRFTLTCGFEPCKLEFEVPDTIEPTKDDES